MAVCRPVARRVLPAVPLPEPFGILGCFSLGPPAEMEVVPHLELPLARPWAGTDRLCSADLVAQDGVTVEVIDLRTISPLDLETIEVSVRRTGRLVVVHEDSRTTGIGQAIIAEMVSTPERFNLFFAPPQQV